MCFTFLNRKIFAAGMMALLIPASFAEDISLVNNTLMHVFSFLSPKQLAEKRLVNKRWKKCAESTFAQWNLSFMNDHLSRKNTYPVLPNWTHNKIKKLFLDHNFGATINIDRFESNYPWTYDNALLKSLRGAGIRELCIKQGLNNHDIDYIKTFNKLETLHLINTNCTNVDFASLSELQNLSVIVLEYETLRHMGLICELYPLKQIKELHIIENHPKWHSDFNNFLGFDSSKKLITNLVHYLEYHPKTTVTVYLKDAPHYMVTLLHKVNKCSEITSDTWEDTLAGHYELPRFSRGIQKDYTLPILFALAKNSPNLSVELKALEKNGVVLFLKYHF